MSAQIKQQHTHKLKKVKYKSGNSTFFCTLDCSYKISIPLALGKKSICWRCGDEFFLTEYSIRLVHPHCDACHHSKKIVHDEVVLAPAIPWVHKPSDVEKEAAKELVEFVSLAERLKQTIADKQEGEEDI